MRYPWRLSMLMKMLSKSTIDGMTSLSMITPCSEGTNYFHMLLYIRIVEYSASLPLR